MKEIGKVLGRSKAYNLELLKDRPGKIRFENLDREKIIQSGKDRATEGEGRSDRDAVQFPAPYPQGLVLTQFRLRIWEILLRHNAPVRSPQRRHSRRHPPAPGTTDRSSVTIPLVSSRPRVA